MPSTEQRLAELEAQQDTSGPFEIWISGPNDEGLACIWKHPTLHPDFLKDDDDGM